MSGLQHTIWNRHRFDDLATADHADIAADGHTGDRLGCSRDSRLNLAGPPDEAPLRQDYLRPRLREAIADEIGGGGASRAARRHILDKSSVIPGAPLARLRVEDVDELGADLAQQCLESGMRDTDAL